MSEYIEDKGMLPKMTILKGGKNPRKSIRTDRNGALIDKSQRKYKISFADNVTND